MMSGARTQVLKNEVLAKSSTRFPAPPIKNDLRSFFITWVYLRGVFFKTPRENIADFRNHGLLFTHFITWVKKVRRVLKKM